MHQSDILAAAKRAPDKASLTRHREAVRVLRNKGYTWRDIAKFLTDNGIAADHTTLFRTFKDIPAMTQTIEVPDAAAYQSALTSIKLNEAQKAMLIAHYSAHNRSITYTELARAAGKSDHEYANRWYGEVGRRLGKATGFVFNEYLHGNEIKDFYSSAIGQQNHYASGEFQLVMHHELAKALEALGWVAAPRA